jgi:hypothetical protein
VERKRGAAAEAAAKLASRLGKESGRRLLRAGLESQLEMVRRSPSDEGREERGSPRCRQRGGKARRPEATTPSGSSPGVMTARDLGLASPNSPELSGLSHNKHKKGSTPPAVIRKRLAQSDMTGKKVSEGGDHNEPGGGRRSLASRAANSVGPPRMKEGAGKKASLFARAKKDIGRLGKAGGARRR